MKRKTREDGGDAKAEAPQAEEIGMVYGIEGKPPKV